MCIYIGYIDRYIYIYTYIIHIYIAGIYNSSTTNLGPSENPISPIMAQDLTNFDMFAGHRSISKGFSRVLGGSADLVGTYTGLVYLHGLSLGHVGGCLSPSTQLQTLFEFPYYNYV